jgi:CheY-like chemotaxis protein
MSIKVLYVDDEANLREIAKISLESYDPEIEVSLSGDGIEALEVIKETSFDVIISDCDMPRMDGLELLKSIRESGDYTPFIFYTSRVESDNFVRIAFKQGTTYVVNKGKKSTVFTYVALTCLVCRCIYEHRIDNGFIKKELTASIFAELASYLQRVVNIVAKKMQSDTVFMILFIEDQEKLILSSNIATKDDVVNAILTDNFETIAQGLGNEIIGASITFQGTPIGSLYLHRTNLTEKEKEEKLAMLSLFSKAISSKIEERSSRPSE